MFEDELSSSGEASEANGDRGRLGIGMEKRAWAQAQRARRSGDHHRCASLASPIQWVQVGVDLKVPSVESPALGTAPVEN